MRFLIIAAAATILMLPATAPAKAPDAGMHSAKGVATDYSARSTSERQRRRKVEYMRGADV